MSTQFLTYVIYGTIAVFFIILVAYYILKKRIGKSEYQQIKKLRQGTERSKFSWEILYQKLYITYSKIPYIKTYVFYTYLIVFILFVVLKMIFLRSSNPVGGVPH